jgi:LCP family protein required for cell wall assembly
MIRQHLAEAEQNIRQSKPPAIDPDTECDLLELDCITPHGAAPPKAPPSKFEIDWRSTEDLWEFDTATAPVQRRAAPTQRKVESGTSARLAASAGVFANTPPAPPPQTVASGTANPRRKSKRGAAVKKFFAFVVVFAVLVGALGVGFLYYEAGKVQFAAADPEKAALRPTGADLCSGLGVTNILLIGLDAESSGSVRSDSMLLLSIDRNTNSLKLCSFLRDSWVQLPGGGEAKLNAAFAKGGAELLRATLEQNFRVRIDHYITVDFDGFEAIIDSMGGVAVPVTDREADFLCKTTRLGKQIGREGFTTQMANNGNVQFTGEQALIYCRIRKLDSDFQRTQRQRKVLNALVAKVKADSVFDLFQLPDVVLPCIRTDMRQTELTKLLLAAPFYMQYETIQHNVPAAGTYQDAKKQGSAVLELDFDVNIAQLEEFIYGK